MSNLQEKVDKEYPLYDIPNSVSRTDEYNGNEIQFIKRSAFQNGYEQCQKEYEEKLRWIPVEEKLPELREKQYQVESMSVAGTRSQWTIESEHDIESLKGLRIAWRYFL